MPAPPAPLPHLPDRDLDLLSSGWQFNSQSGLYRLPGGEWMDHAAARLQAFGPPPPEAPSAPLKPTVLEEIRDELRGIRQAIERLAQIQAR